MRRDGGGGVKLRYPAIASPSPLPRVSLFSSSSPPHSNFPISLSLLSSNNRKMGFLQHLHLQPNLGEKGLSTIMTTTTARPATTTRASASSQQPAGRNCKLNHAPAFPRSRSRPSPLTVSLHAALCVHVSLIPTGTIGTYARILVHLVHVPVRIP